MRKGFHICWIPVLPVLAKFHFFVRQKLATKVSCVEVINHKYFKELFIAVRNVYSFAAEHVS